VTKLADVICTFADIVVKDLDTRNRVKAHGAIQSRCYGVSVHCANIPYPWLFKVSIIREQPLALRGNARVTETKRM